MHARHFIAAVLAGLMLHAPAFAHEPRVPLDAIIFETLFKGVVREDDVTLLFKHLRESTAAAARGDEVPREPEALTRRSEEIGREMAKRGGVLMDALLSAFEKAARQAIREGF